MFWTKIAVVSALVCGAAAWGDLGHETVGYVAQAFLSPNAAAFVKSSLGSTYNESLGVAATWADKVKYTKGYRWSAPLHFVDAQDSPLTGSCSVQEARDCGGSDCILSAIANYTTRVQDTSLSTAQRQEALKFLDHFLGDVGQPLHVENYEVGGNEIAVTCAKAKDNLHSVWDTGIITVNLKTNYEKSVPAYAADLVTRIQSGAYESDAADWISCSSITELATKRSLRGESMDLISARKSSKAGAIAPLACPLLWAQEANSYDCTAVFDYTKGADLCVATGSYYQAAVPIIDMQLAKQGYRLAAWLNMIFDGATGM